MGDIISLNAKPNSPKKRSRRALTSKAEPAKPATVTGLPIDRIALARAILDEGRDEFYAAVDRLHLAEEARLVRNVEYRVPGAQKYLDDFRAKEARRIAFDASIEAMLKG